MDGERDLALGLQEAAARLRAEGADATAEGTRLISRRPGGLQVVVWNGLTPAAEGDWERLLSDMATALLEAAADEPGSAP